MSFCNRDLKALGNNITAFHVTNFFFSLGLSHCILLGLDQELRNVIDKLAQFVARNGPEFEKMTMEKQKDNPKFSFLFGGEYFSYYKYKLTMAQQQSMYSYISLTNMHRHTY